MDTAVETLTAELHKVEERFMNRALAELDASHFDWLEPFASKRSRLLTALEELGA